MTKYFRHYKGKYYQYIGEAIHSETLERMVIYRALYGERKTWARPYGMFFESVMLTTGECVPRFAPCSEEEAMQKTQTEDSLEPLVQELHQSLKNRGYIAEDFRGGCSLCGEENEFALDAICQYLEKNLPDIEPGQRESTSRAIYSRLYRVFLEEEQK